jgi:hypothetical protein
VASTWPCSLVSCGVNVALLFGQLSVLVLGRAGLFSQGSPPSVASSPASAVSTASPRVSEPTAVPSSTPVSGWLQVTPSRVQLGCANGQQTQFVVLENTRPEQLQWQATFSVAANQVGVNVGPNQGTLSPGTSTQLQIQNQAHANGPQGMAGRQGVMEFNPAMPDAGPSASLTYTTVGCN